MIWPGLLMKKKVKEPRLPQRRASTNRRLCGCVTDGGRAQRRGLLGGVEVVVVVACVQLAAAVVLVVVLVGSRLLLVRLTRARVDSGPFHASRGLRSSLPRCGTPVARFSGWHHHTTSRRTPAASQDSARRHAGELGCAARVYRLGGSGPVRVAAGNDKRWPQENVEEVRAAHWAPTMPNEKASRVDA